MGLTDWLKTRARELREERDEFASMSFLEKIREGHRRATGPIQSGAAGLLEAGGGALRMIEENHPWVDEGPTDYALEEAKGSSLRKRFKIMRDDAKAAALAHQYDPDRSRMGEAIAEKARDWKSSVTPDDIEGVGFLDRLKTSPFDAVAYAAGDLVPYAAAAAAGPGAAPMVFGTQALGGTYEGLREEGASPGAAAGASMAMAPPMAVLEKLPFTSLTQGLKGGVAQRIGQQATTEATTEFLQAFPAEAARTLAGTVGEDEDGLAQRGLRQGLEGGAQALLLGGLGGMAPVRADDPKDIIRRALRSDGEFMAEAIRLNAEHSTTDPQAPVPLETWKRHLVPEGRLADLGDFAAAAYDSFMLRDREITMGHVKAFHVATAANQVIDQATAEVAPRTLGILTKDAKAARRAYRDQINADLTDWLEDPMSRDRITLPEGLEPLAERMREMMDSNSESMVGILNEMGLESVSGRSDDIPLNSSFDLEMDLPAGFGGDRAEALLEGMNQWLRRSYRARLDPEFAKNVRMNIPGTEGFGLRDAAVDEALRTPYQEGGLAGLNDRFAPMQPGDTPLPRPLAVGMFNQMIETNPDSVAYFGTSGESIAAAGRIMAQRQNVLPEARKMLGEVPDPIVRFVDGANRQQHFISTFRGKERLLELGRDSLFFEGQFPPGHATKKIELGVVMGPDGLPRGRNVWTTPEVADAIKQFEEATSRTGNMWIDGYLGTQGAIKKMLTVYNLPTTHLRNLSFWAQGSMSLGHSPDVVYRAAKVLARRSKGDAWTDGDARDMGFKDKAELEPYIEKMTELGIWGEGLAGRITGETRDWLAAGDVLEARTGANKRGKLPQWARKASSKIDFLYGLEDDVPRLILARRQQLDYEKAGYSPEKAMVLAADSVRTMAPTWSMAAPITSALRKMPFAFPFPTFQAEYLRSQQASLRQGNREMWTSDNPHIRKMGARRVVGNLFGNFVFWSMAEGIGRMAGQLLNSDEEEAIRNVAAQDHQRDANLLVHDLGDGTFLGTDLGTLSPAYDFTQGIASGLDRDGGEGALMALFQGFSGPEVGISLYHEFAGERSPLSSEKSLPENAMSATGHVLKRIAPGRAQVRLAQSLGSDPRQRSGLGLDWRVEALNQVSPLRFQHYTPAYSMQFKLRGIRDRLNETSALWKEGAYDLRLPLDEAIAGQPAAEEHFKSEVWPDIVKLLDDAQKLGVHPAVIKQQWKDAGLPTRLLNPAFAKMENPPPLVTSKQMKALMEARGKQGILTGPTNNRPGRLPWQE